MNQQFLKEIEKGSKSALVKKRIITHYIYNGSSTIPDLSKELDLSVPTVTKFIGEMCDDGYINDYGKLETSGGRHPNLYGLNPESGYFLGVDIKRFAVNIGLINFKGDMVELKMNIPYKFENSIEGMNELCKHILNFIKKLTINKEKILNINVNVSGRVNPESGYSFSQFNFEERPLADVLSEKLGYKVTIDNDTRAMTYGEYMQGCVKGEKDIIKFCYECIRIELDKLPQYVPENAIEQPKIYDVDKIVDQLEEEKEYANADFEEYAKEVEPCLDAEYDDTYS